MARAKKIKEQEIQLVENAPSSGTTPYITEKAVNEIVDGVSKGLMDVINEPIEVHFEKIDPDAVIPTKAYITDIGYDVVATRVDWDYETDTYIYHTGLACELEPGTFCMGVPRSSNSKTGSYLTNSVGVIDPDYRGEIQFRYKNRMGIAQRLYVNEVQDYLMAPWYKKITTSQKNKLMGDIITRWSTKAKDLAYAGAPYKVGDRVGQFIFWKSSDVNITEVDELSETERGAGGFGSTGK